MLGWNDNPPNECGEVSRGILDNVGAVSVTVVKTGQQCRFKTDIGADIQIEHEIVDRCQSLQR